MRGKIGSKKEYACIHSADFGPHQPKHSGGSLLRGGDAVVSLRQSTRARKHIRDASFFGCLRVIVVDLDALEDKFVANSGPKTAEKTYFL